MDLFYKCTAGAMIMLLLHFLTRSNMYYVTGMVVFFPVFSLPLYYFMYSEQGIEEIQKTNIFTLWSLIPYIGFIFTVFITVKKFGIVPALLLSLTVWFVLAIGVLVVWKQLGYG